MKYGSLTFRAKPQLLRCAVYIGFLLATVIACSLAVAEDWPTYQHDNSRSGVTSEGLNLPLSESWRYISAHAPRQAWPDPARQDFWHHLYGIRARVRYDQTYHVAVAGNALYFGSSADDKVYCLDASTGDERWSFFTGGPVRLAPAVWEGRIYVGSDDGHVYCLEAESGKLIWKYRASLRERRIPGNSRMISVWPVRSGVLVKDGIAYFCSGLFPKESVYFCALNAVDGSEIWKETPAISPQGYLLSSETRLYVPTGRTAPAVFNREDGKPLGDLSCPRAEGGTYALLTRETLVSGPGTRLREFDTNTRDQIATFNGRRMIVTERVSYLLSDSELSAIDRTMYSTVKKQQATIAEERKKLAGELSDMREKRKETSDDELEKLDEQIVEMVGKMAALDSQLRELTDSEYKWRRPCNRTYHSMILAGDLLFLGGDDEVVALNASEGEQLWSSETQGKAYGLAVANGHLFVSTDEGVIHCFSERFVAIPSVISPSVTTSPYPEDDLTRVYASAAERIVNETGIRKGYCLALGCGEGRLAYELAKRTELNIIGIEEDEKKVQTARKALDEAGLYGVRVAVHQGEPAKLPYTDYFANLIVSDSLLTSGEMPTSADEVFRVLRPHGGMAYLGQTSEAAELSLSTLEEWLQKASVPGWKTIEQNGLWVVMRRRPLDGGGEWTHQYADPGNSACSGDRLVRDPMQVQWFGKPGPRPMIDRHNHALAPLAKDGRLFVPAAGESRVIAVDAYNGAILWDVEVPNYRRVGANKDAGNMVVTDDYLYIATEDSCWALDVGTGQHLLTFKVPPVMSKRHWGYIASADNLLFGSGQKKTASFRDHSLAVDYEVYFDSRPIATSDYLFCLNRHDGQTLWHYRKGIIINSAIAVGDEHVYFVESRNPEALADSDGRIKLDVLLADGHGYLVALDRRAGGKVWEQQVGLTFEHAIHLSYAHDTVLVLGTRNEGGHPRYDLRAFSADDGSVKWSNHSVKTIWGVNGDHGEQDQHAVIVGDNIYLIQSHSYSLQTGEENPYKLNRGGHGCGTLSGAASYLFARGGNPRMYKISTDGEETGTALTNINRPGCWINIIPAGGLVLIPEFSSGCTCSYPIQASIALVPRERN